MAYNWLTQYNSPNYTPANRVQATWGRPRTIEAIAIHWWGDPAQNPSFESVVSYLCRPGGASAHIVATGTGRRAACLVNLSDASWATNSANPYTISIECDPRCRDEDYDVIGEVIAQLRSIYGNLPLVPHRQFVATACPGNYDLNRLNQVAASKQVGKSDVWGNVSNKSTPAPTPPQYDDLYRVLVGGKQVAAYSTPRNAYDGWVAHGSNGKITFKGNDVTAKVVNDHKPVVTTKDETKDVVLDFEVKTVNDDTLNKGKQEVKQKGVLGKRTIVTRVTYTDGKETKREVISDKVTVEPVAEIVHIGTHNPKQPPVENTPDEPIDIPDDKPEDEYKPIPEPTEEKTQSSPLMRFVTWLLKLLSDFWNAKR